MVKEDMLMKKLFVLAGIAAFFCASCQQEIEVSIDNLKTIDSIEAVISGETQSKACIADGYKYQWSDREAIGVFSDTDGPVQFGKNNPGNVFYSTNGQSLKGHEFYAYYPYEAVWPDESDRMVLRMGVGNSARGKHPSALQLPMYARSDGRSLEFKHLCSVLHFSITGKGKLSSISLMANGSERIQGTVTIDLRDSTPELKFEEGWEGIREWFWQPESLPDNEPLDIWFAVPPITLKSGFSLTLGYEGKTITKTYLKSVTIPRATVKSFSLLNMEELVEEDEATLPLEREALIALYNATDGPHWVNNTNWCSDRPLSEWYGVTTGYGNEHVYGLRLVDNALNGAIPEDITKLKNLSTLDIQQKNGRITNMDPVFDLPALTNLSFGIGETWMVSDYPALVELMPSIPAGISKLKTLRMLFVTGITEDLPDELFEMEHLQSLSLNYMETGRPLQTGLGRLKNLTWLSIGSAAQSLVPESTPVCGTLPDDIYDLKNLRTLEIIDTHIGGELSPRIGDFQELTSLNLPGNKFSGPLPAELARLSILKRSPQSLVVLQDNNFSGKVPESFRNWPEWQLLWGYIVDRNQLDFSEVMPTIPQFEATTIDGGTVSSAVTAENELTMLFQWFSWCPWSPVIVSELKELYPAYKDKGLEVISYTNEDDVTAKWYADSNGFTWPTIANEYNEGAYPLGVEMYPYNVSPAITIFDKSGRLVYYQFGADTKWKEFIEERLGSSGLQPYESTDFSADGTVHTLQAATRGAGIDLVLMGDAFSDRLISDGTYAAWMQKAADAFFGEEPYKSFRDCFNVYYVDVVSKNERYDGDTALKTWYGSGTAVGGNDTKVVEYIRKTLPESRIDDAMAIVLMNRDYYAGTCYMYGPLDGDYGRGLSISYFPVSSNDATFSGLVTHEAGGHGFAKLADEYYYTTNGTIPEDKVADYHAAEPFGWWKNGDFTSDPASVKWSAFISDSRYATEGIGVYQGAFTYYSGAWRSTRNSIMNNNTGGYNAPSRYAIWYRINKLAFGTAGTYEDFVSYDAVNRVPSAIHRRAVGNRPDKEFEPLAPPVVVSKDWRTLVTER